MNTNTSFLIRPIRESDESALTELVGQIGDGLTSLPKDKDFLKTRIHESLRAFYPKITKPAGEFYLFVLEEVSTKRLIGTSGILAKVGGFDPFYTYKVVQETATYPPLAIVTPNNTLHLSRSHSGPTEICSLFLHPDFRMGGLGRLLSFSRFLFIKSFPERFDKKIIAELRGYINEMGESPFWNAVGAKFFQYDYYTADILSGLGNKDFIEALMPKYPIYISLLPQEARDIIGRVHPHTEPALKILAKEGFKETNEVDIFDAGPLLEAKRDELSIWKSSKTLPFRCQDSQPMNDRVLIANPRLDFRATITEADVDCAEYVTIKPEIAEVLELSPQDKVIYVRL